MYRKRGGAGNLDYEIVFDVWFRISIENVVYTCGEWHANVCVKCKLQAGYWGMYLVEEEALSIYTIEVWVKVLPVLCVPITMILMPRLLVKAWFDFILSKLWYGSMRWQSNWSCNIDRYAILHFGIAEARNRYNVCTFQNGIWRVWTSLQVLYSTLHVRSKSRLYHVSHSFLDVGTLMQYSYRVISFFVSFFPPSSKMDVCQRKGKLSSQYIRQMQDTFVAGWHTGEVHLA